MTTLELLSELKDRIIILEARAEYKPTACDKNITAVKRLVSDHFEIPLPTLEGRLRTDRVAMARFTAIVLCKSLPVSHAEIARAFRRDHAMVGHASRMVTDRCDSCAAFRAKFLACKEKLKSVVSNA